MSGGVDSSVAAYLTKEQGYDCIGVTMRLFNDYGNDTGGTKSCCSLDDCEDARSVARRLDIPYYVFNFTDDFTEQVIKRFVNAYENGATPNPCIDCNRYLKFRRLYFRALEIGCDRIATGHYARIEKKNGRYLLKKAADKGKDQSYVLYFLSQEQLAHTLFPLGEKNKSDIRKIAGAQGFCNADKPDSQDICFVTRGRYSQFIKSFTGRDYLCGDFTDKNGNVIGRHEGIIGYTVGQRRGLGISADEALYVIRICPEDNNIVLGKRSDLYQTELYAESFNCISCETLPRELRAKVKTRYRQEEQWATVYALPNDRARIVFDAPQKAAAKGQAAVLYDDDIVIGGGIIT
ncbi:MAG: tRNA 2-thiouridine(34) synthase MnmA [Bacteroides sp.]|nr:tRNA 2-thiouridine(34) synthase MnmA [Bacteroides sp.]